jgi:voltage-gated potassium channel
MNNLSQTKFTPLNLIVIILTIYVLGALVIDTLYVLPEETSKLILYFDYVICGFFFIEFSIRFYKAESKLKFMRWGWIDLLASIPMVDFLRYGRVIRLIRLLRVIKAFRTVNEFVSQVFENRAKGTFSSVSVVAILLIIFSSIAILGVENDPESNIQTAEDALWWAFATISTAGYGDKFPVTTEGRIIAAVLMTAGIGLFGTFTAYIASWFVGERR